MKGSEGVYAGQEWKSTFRSVCRWMWEYWSVPWSAMVRGVHWVVSELLAPPGVGMSRAVGSLDPGEDGTREYEGMRHERGTSLWTKNSRRWYSSSGRESMVQVWAWGVLKGKDSGRRVSLQMAKGMYCRFPRLSVICVQRRVESVIGRGGSNAAASKLRKFVLCWEEAYMLPGITKCYRERL